MKTILVVDDEYDIVSTLEMVFSMEGYSVITAFNGKEALTKIKDSTLPDLIISDVMMPTLDGYEFSLQLRKDPNLHHIPLILMSAAQLDEMKISKDHYKLFMRKPFDLNRLINAVEKILTEKNGQP